MEPCIWNRGDIASSELTAFAGQKNCADINERLHNSAIALTGRSTAVIGQSTQTNHRRSANYDQLPPPFAWHMTSHATRGFSNVVLKCHEGDVHIKWFRAIALTRQNTERDSYAELIPSCWRICDRVLHFVSRFYDTFFHTSTRPGELREPIHSQRMYGSRGLVLYSFGHALLRREVYGDQEALDGISRYRRSEVGR
jgi:hypothetical protein